MLLITTAYRWCMTTLAVSDKCIPEWLSISCSLQDWGLVYWNLEGCMSIVRSPESWVRAARCSYACVMHWKVKVTSSLTDVWQQLFEQFYAPFTLTLGCMKTTPVHQRLETPTETDTQEHVYRKPARYVHELKWHLIEIWSATSRVSLINR